MFIGSLDKKKVWLHDSKLVKYDELTVHKGRIIWIILTLDNLTLQVWNQYQCSNIYILIWHINVVYSIVELSMNSCSKDDSIFIWFI